jgi:putative protease
MLKITVPFRMKKEVIPLIEAGANELYCGYLPGEWKRKYTDLEFERKGQCANFTNLKELKAAVESAHKKDTPVYLTLNGLYVQQQYNLLLKILEDLKVVDFDGYIIADLGLLLTLRARGFKKQIHVSTGGTVFNQEAVSFYRELGASRIVLDRQVTLKSMRQLSAANPDIEFEVFILHTLCVYIDGFCTFLHMYGSKPLPDNSGNIKTEGKNIPFSMMSTYDVFAGGDACTLKYSIRTRLINGRQNCAKEVKPVFYKHLSDGIECGACALYDIAKTNVKSVKIVGRQLSAGTRLGSVKFISQSLDILRENKGTTRKDFISKVQGLYRQMFVTSNPERSQRIEHKKECRGNNCYHPEVLL